MKTILYYWLGLNVAFVVVQELRYQVKQYHLRQLERDLLRAIAQLRENDHTEGLIEDAWRQAAKRNAEAYRRLYTDAGLTPPDEANLMMGHGTATGHVPRVVESEHGVFVRAHCVEEAAEIVSQAHAFRPAA